MNNTATSMGVQISLWDPAFISLGYMPRSGIARSYDNSKGFSGGSVVKKLPTSAGDTSSIPGSGRFPGEGNGNPLQYSLEEPGGLQSLRSQKKQTTT